MSAETTQIKQMLKDVMVFSWSRAACAMLTLKVAYPSSQSTLQVLRTRNKVDGNNPLVPVTSLSPQFSHCRCFMRNCRLIQWFFFSPSSFSDFSYCHRERPWLFGEERCRATLNVSSSSHFRQRAFLLVLTMYRCLTFTKPFLLNMCGDIPHPFRFHRSNMFCVRGNEMV